MSGIIDAPPHGFDLGRVLALTGAVAWRRRSGLAWVFVLGWTPQALAILIYQPMMVSAIAPRYFAFVPAIFLAAGLVGVFSRMLCRTVAMALVLEPAAPNAHLTDAFAATLRATPALAPIWAVVLFPEIAHLLAGAFAASWLRENSAVILLSWPISLTLALTLGVYTPVVLAERRGVMASIRRTVALMRGARWKFLALYLGVQAIALLARAVTRLDLPLLAHRLSPANAVMANAFVDTAFLSGLEVAFGLACVMAYRELARVQDGVAPSDIAAVFA